MEASITAAVSDLPAHDASARFQGQIALNVGPDVFSKRPIERRPLDVNALSQGLLIETPKKLPVDATLV